MQRAWWTIFSLVAAWAVIAYVIMPLWWERYAQSHTGLDEIPRITATTAGIPGDPVNVALVGSQDQLRAIFAAAGWSPADPLSLRSDARIAADALFDRPYPDAPVSTLTLFGRKQDMAFEQSADASPRQRHHIRLWRTPRPHASGAPLWIGAASFDRSVGLSHDTGQITHHIAADVDAERDHVIADLEATGMLSEIRPVPDFHIVRSGHNGGGDPWRTNGTLILVVVAAIGVSERIR